MLNSTFASLYNATTGITLQAFLICIGAALLLGAVLALVYCFRTAHSTSFVVTLALLPAVVCVVIMMVNGNVGAGVAVAGAFSLVRFRSVPGTAKEISMLFIAMGTGLVVGMGYLAYGLLFAVLMCLIGVVYNHLDLGIKKNEAIYKTLNITIPEDIDYTEVFAPVLQEYTKSCELVRVKTTNMGSLFRLTYDVVLKDAAREKEMIDALRCRNGNLEISVSRQDTSVTEL